MRSYLEITPKLGEKSLSTFLDSLFEAQTGYVYVPSIKRKVFIQKFFKWPEDRLLIIRHIKLLEHVEDVYLSPMLFNKPIISPESFKGTNYLWTEFDGETPNEPQIAPSIRLQSSTSGHEHWYWRLNTFATDIKLITDYTKRLAYSLNADLSAWDYQQILRPPNTTNHKRRVKTKLLEFNNTSYDIETFSTIPQLPLTEPIKLDLDHLPDLTLLIAKYTWNDDAIDLLTKDATVDRSAALVRLAFHCIENGLSNDETYVVIEYVDRRWGKYLNRTDRHKRLLGIISHVRNRLATAGEITHDTKIVYRFKDFLSTQIKLDWVIPGLIPVAGASMIFGPPGLGKSTWALRMSMAIAGGQIKFLTWDIVKQQKVLFLSLEMPHEELKSFFEDMKITNIEPLQENFHIWPIGYPYPLDTPDQQRELLKYIDMLGIELLVIDSLGVAMYGDVSNDNDIKRLNSFLNEDLRKKRGCGYFFVHHPRKPGVSDTKKPRDMYDSFGSSYIINNAQTIFNLNPAGSPGVVEVNIFKSRLSQEQQSFKLQRTSNRDFKLITKDTTGRIPFGSLGH